MIAGHLQEKNDFYYVVLNYKDSAGKRHTKWCRTGLPVKGNKKRAEAMLMELRLSFDPEAEEAARRIRKGESPALDFEMAQSEGGRLLFADYLEQWLKVARSTVKTITYSGYAEEVQKRINPWFRERGIALTELQASDIQDFYSFRLETVKATTVIHDHAVIHRALKYAVKMDMIPVNPADKVERPRKEAFQASFYDRNELNRLFEAAKGTRLEIPVMLAAFYGLRRSEVLGLRWDAIDFDNDTITIRHTVTSFNMDGKHMLIASDTTKLGGGDAGGTGFEGLGGIKKAPPDGHQTEFGGSGGIRTHVPSRTTAFRVQLVTTASIRFHAFIATSASGFWRELMERTKLFTCLRKRSKALQHRGFRDQGCQHGQRISSRGRYDHFDTLP